MTRIDEMHRDALRILDDARREHFASHEMTAAVVLFSGGNDSTVLAHLMRPHATHFGHCNTGIGVEETRQFVRTISADWGVPLLEYSPDPQDSYEALVVERGFPGPGAHYKMYQRLKERQIRKMRRALVSDGRKQRVLFIAGRRRQESKRRMNIPEHEREGAAVWVSPLANWTDDDMAAYRHENPDVPRNEVTDHLHMSGECLCGAFAKKGELDQIRFFYPDVAVQIDNLAQRAHDAGVPHHKCVWGWGAYKDDPDGPPEQTGMLCSSCTLGKP